MPLNLQILPTPQLPPPHHSPLHHPPLHLHHFHHLVIPIKLQLPGHKFSKFCSPFVRPLILILRYPPTSNPLSTPSPPQLHPQHNLHSFLQTPFQFHSLRTLQVPHQSRPLRSFVLPKLSTRINKCHLSTFLTLVIQLTLNHY